MGKLDKTVMQQLKKDKLLESRDDVIPQSLKSQFMLKDESLQNVGKLGVNTGPHVMTCNATKHAFHTYNGR